MHFSRLDVQRQVISALERCSESTFSVDLSAFVAHSERAFVFSAAHGAFRAWRSNQRFRRPHQGDGHRRTLEGGHGAPLRDDTLREALTIERYAQLVKWLVDTPRRDLGPTRFARALRRYGKTVGIAVSVEQADVAALPAASAVATGSGSSALLITLSHTGDPRPDAPRIAICGKGVTFDSGGLGLKPQSAMRHMKTDMAGGAIAAATVMAASALKLPVNVTAYIVAVENAIGPSALAPGDLISYQNGLTVEVTDVDAEGRLILADLCTLALARSASHLVTIGTLSTVVSWVIGHDRAGLFSSDNLLRDCVIKAQQDSGEHVWPLPLPNEHRDLMAGGWVDFVNSAGPEYGGIQPALFLAPFVAQAPWAHLEVSGPTWNNAWSGTGGTGFGVTLLTRALQHFASDIGGHRD